MTFPSRIADEGDGKTTPEELLAASHAVCYAMVLTNTIGKQGGKARRVRVTATVTADKSDAGIKVVSSHLKADRRGARRDRPGQAERARDGRREGLPHLERDPRQRQHHGRGERGIAEA